MKKLEWVDYRGFRPNKLLTKEYRHINYLFFWILYGFLFQGVENWSWINENYYPMHCAFDELIPFCEYFVIPYVYWFVYLIGFLVFSFFFDVESFTRSMRFIAVTYILAIVVYVLFPNGQDLRPVVFGRDNIFSRVVAGLYQTDTNTNVCPSIHVIGSFAVMLPAWHSKYFRTWLWRAIYGVLAVLISVSTVFLKQHSIIDVLAAVPVCVLGYFVAYFDVFRSKFGAKVQRKQESIQG